jgi:hypothetical protein
MTAARRILTRSGILALAVVVAACSSSRTERPAVAVSRASVALLVEPAGDLRVVEQFDLPASAAVFARRVAPHTADGVAFVSATLDEMPLTRDATGSVLTVRDGGVLDVSIRLPRDAGTHRIELQYRARHAVGVIEGHGYLEWPIFGADDLAVDAATTTLTWPDGQHESGPTGIAEAGWIVSRTARGITASRATPGRQPATVVAAFSIDRTRTPMPEWQVADDLRREFAPAFVSGALFVLVIGAGVLWMLRFKYPRLSGAVAAPVAWVDLPPADLSALLLPAKTWPWRALQDPDVVRLARAGLLDRERLAAANGLRVSGLVCVVFSLTCMVAAAMLLPRFGWWAQAIPGSMLAVSVLFVLAAPWLGVLTDRGVRARREALAGAARRPAAQYTSRL